MYRLMIVAVLVAAAYGSPTRQHAQEIEDTVKNMCYSIDEIQDTYPLMAKKAKSVCGKFAEAAMDVFDEVCGHMYEIMEHMSENPEGAIAQEMKAFMEDPHEAFHDFGKMMSKICHVRATPEFMQKAVAKCIMENCQDDKECFKGCIKQEGQKVVVEMCEATTDLPEDFAERANYLCGAFGKAAALETPEDVEDAVIAIFTEVCGHMDDMSDEQYEQFEDKLSQAPEAFQKFATMTGHICNHINGGSSESSEEEE